jgi:hypothetical protein
VVVQVASEALWKKSRKIIEKLKKLIKLLAKARM